MTPLPHFVSGFALLAQEAAPAGGQAPGGGQPSSILENPFFLVMPLLLVFYFIVLRPQQREQRARDALLKAIKKNDKVLTTGGIFGVVTNVESDSGLVTVRVDEKNDTKIRMQLSSIARVLVDEGAEKSEKSEKT
jgi:preprotein translocase subunit YajC